jgi:hypothetical protein
MSADIFVYLDTVQFSKNGVQNRHLIKTPKGASWLTLPVKRNFGQHIADARLSETAILEKHLRILRLHYGHTAGFKQWDADLRRLCGLQTDSFCDTAIASVEWILDRLGVTNRRIRASELGSIEGQDSERVAQICRALGATDYLSGRGGLAYMQRAHFQAVGCRVSVQQWTGFEYPQNYSEVGFTPNLSVLDLLFNCPVTAREMIARAGNWEVMWEVEPSQGQERDA